MSQYGSDSDRPRGRRHRPGNDWSGYDSTPQSEREFPDLQPIRPREARGRDGRTQGGFGGGAVPGAFGNQAPPGFQDQAPSQYYGQPEAPQSGYGAPSGYGERGGYGGAPEYGAPEYGGGPDFGGGPGFGAPRPAGRHSAPQPAVAPQPGMPSQPGMTPPGAPRPGGPRRGGRRAGGGSAWDDQDSDDPMAAFSERWHRRGQESPEASRKRKRVYLAGGGVIAIVIAVATYFMISGSSVGANPNLGALVTTFLPGEMQKVPDACTTVSTSALSQAMPGKLKQSAPPLNSGEQSQCSWTTPNSAQNYRVLEVNLNAYSPSSLASGDGSATFSAIDAFGSAQSAKQKPGSGQRPATVATIPNLGSAAFSALQQFQEKGSTTDMATVEVRYHNVLIQVVLNAVGSQQPPSALVSQAQSVAQQVTQKVSG